MLKDGMVVVHLDLFSDLKPMLSNPENHIPLLTNLHYRSFDYTLVCQGSRSCVYSQRLEGNIVGFEVSLIRVAEEEILFGNISKKHVRWPTAEDFGTTAFAYMSFDKAMERFNLLEK